MNKSLAALCVLALAPLAGASVARPDGVLGVDMVGVQGIYINTSSSKSSADFDYNGLGLSFNKNLLDNGEIGVDASFDFGFVTNQNRKDIYGMDDLSYTGSLTVFREGMISPYFRSFITYETVDFDYTEAAGRDDWNDDTIILGGEAGFECHLLPGFSVTPAIAYSYDTRADEDAGIVVVSLSACYWLTERVGLQLSTAYHNRDSSDVFQTSLGFSYHF